MGAAIELGLYADHIGFQIHATWRAMQKKILAGRKKETIKKLSPGSYSIPTIVGLNPGISPLEIAEALFLDASKVAFFLRTFDQDGIIDRVTAAEDKRRINLYLTEKGKAFVTETSEISQSWERLVAASLTADERNVLIALLTKIRSAL